MSENLEKEYSPSQWCKRFDSSEATFNYHVKFVTEVTQKNKEKYKLHANIPYGTTEMEKMDIYFKDVACDNPIFVYIHGGYWQFLNKDVSGYCVEPLVENGFRVIVLDYNLCPNVTLEELVSQVKNAARVIFAYAERTCAKSISFCGHSAGAHLVASILADKEIMTIPNIEILNSVYFISGVYDLNPIRNLQSVNLENCLSLSEQNIQQLSPMFANFDHLKKLKIFKCFVYVAENDSLSFQKQSKDFYCHLHKFGLNAKFEILPIVDHFDIVENLVCPKLSPIMNEIIEELKQYC